MHLTKQLAILILLSVIAFAIIGYGLIFVQIKSTTYTFYGAGGVYDEHGNAIVFMRQIDFNAVGSFSAENKIHVKVTLYNCNSTQLTNYMPEVGFSEAFYYYPTISSKVNVALPLTKESGGNYTTEGDLLWHTSQNTYMYPLQPTPAGSLVYNNATEIEQNSRAVLFISPTSDFLSIQASHTMEQLTWVIVGLTVIMLFPIIQSLKPEKPERQVIKLYINGVDVSKLLSENKAKNDAPPEEHKKRRFWKKGK